MEKSTWKGSFNWQGEIIKLFIHAHNRKQAYNIFIDKLSKRLGMNRSRLTSYFSGNKDNFYIVKE